MATLTNRALSLKTSLGKDVLLPQQLTGNDHLSQAFRFDLNMLSEKGDINPNDILGKDVTLSHELPSGGGKRFFHGIVTEFAQLGYRRRYHQYQAVIRPWFWLLTRTSDCRIFQQMSVPDIFKDVVKQYGFSDYELRLRGSYQSWNYCVQYRETDFNFLNRLLEQEGIYYFFEHQDGKHVMVLADEMSAHHTVSGYDSVPFYPPDAEGQRERDHINAWSFTKSVRTGAYATTDYDFERPRQSFLTSESISSQYAHSKYEVFDFPGDLPVFSGGEASRLAKVRIQELQADATVMQGQGDAAGLSTGYRFKLKQYPRNDLNIEYLITSTRFSLTSDEFDSGHSEGQVEFSLSLEAVDAQIHYRPERRTPKPIVQGAQTAMVVGPGGEEIFTDKYGRVKVQFPWDRQGKADANSSCWIRVAQVWAGKQWGTMHIPRIGQEVIVSFLEGDPDRPIITGRVYNGESMPPWELPANKTQSGILTRSSMGGAATNANAIRFEDKKGSEQLWIHAEKNQDIEVENDETHWVGHDRTKTVDNDETTHVKGNRTETVDKDETITVHGSRKETVDKDETITVHGTRSESVDKDETISISGNRTKTVDKSETISITKDLTESIGQNENVSIGKNQTLSVDGDRTRDVGKEEKVSIGKGQEIEIGDARKITVGKDDSLSVGKKLTIEAGDQVAIVTGSASIVMKKDGTITIKGKDVTIEGSGKINLKASSDITLKGSKVNQN